MHERDVVKTALQRHPSRGENVHLPLEVVTAFRHTGVLQQSLEVVQSAVGYQNPLIRAGSDCDPDGFCEYASVRSLRDQRA